MARVFVGIGSNVDRERNIEAGIRALEQEFGALALSGVYESEAVGFPGGNFLNLVAAFDCEETPEEVAARLRAIEARFGRERNAPRFGPRTLDVDLLLYNQLVRNDAGIKVPRDDVTRYAFVLRPLAEMAPDLRHPVTGQRFADIWAAFDQSAQKLWPAPGVLPASR